MPLLKSMLAGMKRSLSQKPKLAPRLPIMNTQLRIIQKHLRTASSTHDKRMLWCACLFSFFGFMRVSELAAPGPHTYNNITTLMYKNVKIYPNFVLAHIGASKTDQEHAGTEITLARNNSLLCPVRAAEKYTHSRIDTTGPFFQYETGRYLTAKSLNAFIHSVLPNSNKGKYSSHSFRIGAATTAAQHGYSKHAIQMMGRWKSNCYKSYIKPSTKMILKLSRGLAK